MNFQFPTIFLLPFVIQCSLSEVIRLSPYISDTCPVGQKWQDVRTNISSTVISNLPCIAQDGWRKILDVNMSDPNDNCPQGLTLYTNPFRLCGRTQSITYDFCESLNISVGCQSYTSIRGRIKGYQKNTTWSFWGRTDIESSYLDGVSLTYGSPGSRQHIWSFVSAFNTKHSVSQEWTGFAISESSYCPAPGAAVPPFITNDYFCDSGLFPGDVAGTNKLYVEHPLWDGVAGGCNGDPYTPPRCYVNNPPWFHKTLTEATTEDIELRICGYSNLEWGDTLLQEIELYVK